MLLLEMAFIIPIPGHVLLNQLALTPMKHRTTSRVCGAVMEAVGGDIRSLAGYVQRSPSTWHSYVHGNTRPPEEVLGKLAALLQLPSVDALIRWAFQQKKPGKLRPGRKRGQQ